MSLGYRRDRKRSHFWRGLFRWLVVLALGFAAGLVAERYGSISAGRSVAEFEAEVAGLFETVAELEIANARLKGTVEADAVRIAELERRYERDVAPTEARELLDAVRDRLAAGVEQSRLAFVIGAARNERECAEAPATRRFIVETPIYDGPNDSVSFAENTITVTAQGRSATDEAGNPEAWFDPAHDHAEFHRDRRRTNGRRGYPAAPSRDGPGRHRVPLHRRPRRPRLRRGNGGSLRLPLSLTAEPCRRRQWVTHDWGHAILAIATRVTIGVTRLG